MGVSLPQAKENISSRQMRIDPEVVENTSEEPVTRKVM
jgi:hypothetical protein